MPPDWSTSSSHTELSDCSSWRRAIPINNPHHRSLLTSRSESDRDDGNHCTEQESPSHFGLWAARHELPHISRCLPANVQDIDSGCCSNQPLAKDFSGVYIGAWRLFHDPSGFTLMDM